MIPNYEAIKIAIVRPDGGVSIMAFLTIGRGNILPEGAVWLDEKTGSWARSPTESTVAGEVRRAMPDFVAWYRVADDDIPTDRTFRDALHHNGKALVHDIEKARSIKRDHLRHERASALPLLDNEWMKATGQGDKKSADLVEAKRQKWRDAPADPRIDAAKTGEELKAVTGPV
jgi:hypothetical protein